jgi:hypothetical protein
MSTKSIHTQPAFVSTPSYRKANADYLKSLVGFVIVFGIMLAVMIATIAVAIQEQ